MNTSVALHFHLPYCFLLARPLIDAFLLPLIPSIVQGGSILLATSIYLLFGLYKHSSFGSSKINLHFKSIPFQISTRYLPTLKVDIYPRPVAIAPKCLGIVIA